MEELILESDSLGHLILHQADVDWLEIGNPNFYAGFFERDLKRRKELVIGVIRSVAQAGYLQIGQLGSQDDDEPESSSWVEWPGTLDPSPAERSLLRVGEQTETMTRLSVSGE